MGEITMEKKEVLKNLQQSWLHSHEEDTDTEKVYRLADKYDFPLSRGREGFDLKPDNKLAEIGIAPTDGPAQAAGSWHLDSAGNDLKLRLNTDQSASRDMKIKSISKDRLVVKK